MSSTPGVASLSALLSDLKRNYRNVTVVPEDMSLETSLSGHTRTALRNSRLFSNDSGTAGNVQEDDTAATATRGREEEEEGNAYGRFVEDGGSDEDYSDSRSDDCGDKNDALVPPTPAVRGKGANETTTIIYSSNNTNWKGLYASHNPYMAFLQSKNDKVNSKRTLPHREKFMQKDKIAYEQKVISNTYKSLCVEISNFVDTMSLEVSLEGGGEGGKD